MPELIKFNDIVFLVKEFRKVFILSNCRLAFYEPKHFLVKEKEIQVKEPSQKRKKGKNADLKKIKELEFNKKDGSSIFLKEMELYKQDSIEVKDDANIDIDFKDIAKYEKNIDSQINDASLNHNFEEKKLGNLKSRFDEGDEFDIFYDRYTKEEKEIRSFEIKDGKVTIPASFLTEQFEKGIRSLVVRLIPKQKNKRGFVFDPIPLEDRAIILTELRKIKEKTLTFQRKIAQIQNDALNLQSPKEFLAVLNGEENLSQEEIKKQQREGILIYAKKRQEELFDSINKDKIYNVDMLKKVISKKKFKSARESSQMGKYEYAKSFDKKIKDYEEKKESKTQKKVKKFKSNSLKEKNPNPKDIGELGEYAASMLFSKGSTRYISNRRKFDANFNQNSYNFTIPDFLVVVNDKRSIIEVKNVQKQDLTEQISFELKLAQEYELDYIFLCNHYTKLSDSIAIDKEKNEKIINKLKKENPNFSFLNLRVFIKGDLGSRKGFIYHRHMHRSIKTIFKELYLDHLKNNAPNKIVIKRLNLNDPLSIEDELNKDQQLQIPR
ncbi:hypothetical protein JG676_03285 [Campylobacter sp. 2018MI35]|uniref:putative toxin n=1 Tax=Campylobacter sp. 2018MI34 TaxID=2800582 RepID=UPI001908E816|nr:putative toxin [Campylobacter sp. 2018MI34]MBK1991624.1 hypothetical protein [Campylobacter sp. 2018MI34]